MRLFPKNNYSIELNDNSNSAILNLKNQTLSKEQFVANWNNQTFIGEIQKNAFEITLSKKLLGELCVLSGKLENGKGNIEIRTGKIFKIIFVAIALFIFSGIIASIIQNKLELIFQLAISILIVRFVFLELVFRIVSRIALTKLTQIIGIKK